MDTPVNPMGLAWPCVVLVILLLPIPVEKSSDRRGRVFDGGRKLLKEDLTALRHSQ
jgi:hypothetical protein